MTEETRILKLMCWWIERSSSLASTGFPVACLSFLLSFVSFTVTKGCMGTKGSMDQRKKPLCSPVTCVFLLFILLFFFLLSLFSFSVSFLCSLFSAFFTYFSALSFLFFCSLFFFFCSLFLPPLARSLEGFIYSLTYLYLGKIQCINSRMQIPTDVQ
jgi:hypothetical protein